MINEDVKLYSNSISKAIKDFDPNVDDGQKLEYVLLLMYITLFVDRFRHDIRLIEHLERNLSSIKSNYISTVVDVKDRKAIQMIINLISSKLAFQDTSVDLLSINYKLLSLNYNFNIDEVDRVVNKYPQYKHWYEVTIKPILYVLFDRTYDGNILLPKFNYYKETISIRYQTQTTIHYNRALESRGNLKSFFYSCDFTFFDLDTIVFVLSRMALPEKLGPSPYSTVFNICDYIIKGVDVVIFNEKNIYQNRFNIFFLNILTTNFNQENNPLDFKNSNYLIPLLKYIVSPVYYKDLYYYFISIQQGKSPNIKQLDTFKTSILSSLGNNIIGSLEALGDDPIMDDTAVEDDPDTTEEETDADTADDPETEDATDEDEADSDVEEEEDPTEDDDSSDDEEDPEEDIEEDSDVKKETDIVSSNEFKIKLSSNESIDDIIYKRKVCELVRSYKESPPISMSLEELLLLDTWCKEWIFLVSASVTKALLNVLSVTIDD
jgi:hypothetical protein